jgi:hypothetical protein
MKYWVEARDGGKVEGITFRMYRGGYKGVLTGDSFVVPESEWKMCTEVLNGLGGSPIGNSRVKVRARRAGTVGGQVLQGTRARENESR